MRASIDFVENTLQKLDLKPSRSLGQNFCVDGERLKACVDQLPLGEEPVIEIGPGLGGLTELLLDRNCIVTAVEKDEKMAAFLPESFAGKQLAVQNADALRFDFGSQGHPFSVVGNLPYYITTSLCERVLFNRPRVFGCMVQKEAGERFTAKPGDDPYGALSVISQLYYDIRELGTFPEDSFYPAPNVQSVFFSLTEKPGAPAEPIEKMYALVRTCLGMRRKTLKNNLKSVPNGLEALAEIGVKPRTRGETLSPEQFLALYRALYGSAPERSLSTDEKDVSNLTLSDLQPSQFYISEAKYQKVMEWFDPSDLSSFEPIPVRWIDGKPVMLDGHTRAVAALNAGIKNVPICLEPAEWDWEMYRRCVRECNLRDIYTPEDLIPRIIPEEEFWEKWDGWCDRMQAEVKAEREN